MLQMRPWKMSLLLEGNNNSKFQLPRTLQSSALPSGETRRGGETGNISIALFYFILAPIILALCSPTPQNTIHLHPLPQHLCTLLPACSGKGLGTKAGLGAGPRSPGQDTGLWGKCLPQGFLPRTCLPLSPPGRRLIASLPF